MSDRRAGAGVLAAMLVIGACGSSRHETYAEYGATLARDPTIAQSRYNAFACTTCHAEHASDVATSHRIFPGAPLEGATARPSWWGGNVLDLQVAVDDCFEHFMQGPHLDPNGDVAQALDAYLTDLTTHAPADQTRAVAFTVPPTISDLPLGDATHGGDVYQHACATCHGVAHTGEGRIGLASIVPDDTLAAHLAAYGPACTREIFIEKIRHGSFLGYAGNMPPFSTEVMSDADISDVLAYLSVPTGGHCP